MRLLLLLITFFPVSFLSGWFLIEALTVVPAKTFSRVFLFAMLTSATLFFIAMAIARAEFLVFFSTGSLLFIAGYLLNARRFLSGKDARTIPALTRSAGTAGNFTAVIYFTHGEPELYNPVGWLNQFREFDEQRIKFVPFVVRPLFIFLLRKKYLTVGKSNHRQGHINMLHDLEAGYRCEGDDKTRFYLSFLDDEPRPDASLIEALNDGASTIIVATVFLTVSNHTAYGKSIIAKFECEKKFNVKVLFTEPLWNSRTLMGAFIDKVYKHLGTTQKDQVAVALIGHGQPAEWDAEFPTLTEQETSFRNEIIELFCLEGFKKENLGNAWMEFREPKPYSLMEKFVSNNVRKIFFFASSISADAIHSQSDIPTLVHEYPFPPGIEVVNLGAWNNHPLVIKAIKERIDEIKCSI
jgi:hypothetical protein